MSEEASRKRVNYAPNEENTELTVSQGEDRLTLAAGEIFEDTEVRDHLAMLGLTTYLRREAGDAPAEDRLTAVDAAYDRLAAEGTKVFQRKPRTNRGPRKSEKVAALAALEGATTDAVENALARMSKEEQAETLNHERVLDKLESMKRSDDDLQLIA